ncbi:hypothetical protein ACFFUP_04275 [Vibrio ostreicida]|uniref:Uncharacterized protein n=1 Tax=Vibrio ostreicida TaxID=526588 RepID=A0ABT8C065_9VIBR|nr:hypothetical protein [Vibrio ostreicida]MDN3612044.1 hypothetical protein [Vibrio ostreicida]NPD08783.1 hypothetical protein [Vibrio ostreicida]
MGPLVVTQSYTSKQTAVTFSHSVKPQALTFANVILPCLTDVDVDVWVGLSLCHGE